MWYVIVVLPVGHTGDIGFTGSAGAKGATGPVGNTGATGATGVQVIRRRVARQAECPGMRFGNVVMCLAPPSAR